VTPIRHRDGPGPGAGAEELALMLSCAVQIEPTLIRAARLELAPRYDVSAEADLWFSDWVGARSADSICLRDEVAAELRDRLGARLARDQNDPGWRAWNIIEPLHAGHSPALVLQEELAWTTVKVTAGAGESTELEHLLQRALRAVVDERRTGVSDWFAAAWERLPDAVQNTVTAWQLLQTATGPSPVVRPAVETRLELADVYALRDLVPDALVAVRHEGDRLYIRGGESSGGVHIPVPDTRPRVLHVRWPTPRGPEERTLRVEPDRSRSLLVGAGDVEIRTGRGLVYRVEQSPAAVPDARSRGAVADVPARRGRVLTRIERDIEEVAAGRSDTLDLGWSRHHRRLRELPPAVRRLAGLRHLRLAGAALTALPDWLAELPRLQTLDVRGCPLAAASVPPLPWIRWAIDAERLPNINDPARVYGVRIGPTTDREAIAFISDLTRFGSLRLTELSVGVPPWEPAPPWTFPAGFETRLKEIIGRSPELQSLALVDCRLDGVPGPVRELRRLSELRLAGTRPRELPEWLFDLPALTALDLSRNGLSDLPRALVRAAGLTSLDLSGNRFDDIPSAVWQLSSLETLDVRGCPLQRIPPDILRLTALTSLRIDETGPELALPPPEVTHRGLDAIRNFWSQARTSGMDFLFEGHLLLLGDGGVGKTTLARRIVGGTPSIDPAEASTHGVAKYLWRFPAAIRVVDADDERWRDESVRVELSDFSGQDVYRHSFTTRRAVYVLVVDESREDTDLQDRLETLNLLTDGSPLIIVQNRKRGRGEPLDPHPLRPAYPNLVGTFSIDLSDDTGVPALVEQIRRELELRPHIGIPMPTPWRDVRTALEADVREYITANEFSRICAEHGVTHDADVRQLGGFLHDLGVFIHFPDQDTLDHIVVLKPEWAANAIHRVEEDLEILVRRGAFGPKDLRRTWPDQIYGPVRGELVRLMRKFGLCYPAAGTDRWVAPHLLPYASPSYLWDEPGQLVIRYDYEVMPRGILWRLIVALHDLIEDGAVWRTGVVLRRGSARAELREDNGRRRITVRLAPDDPRSIQAEIDQALEDIHRTWPGLRFDRLRSCDCPVCARSSEPTWFRVRELEELADADELVRCPASRRPRDPAALLGELWQPAGQVHTPAPEPVEVFLSYKWGGAAEVLADEIESRLTERGQVVRRDHNQLRYRDSVQRFLRRGPDHKAVVVLLDDAYLRSKNCMFEFTEFIEFADRTDLARSVYPIVLSDADIFDPIGRLGYVRHWEERRTELERAMRGVEPEYLPGIREELDLYEKIRNMVARILDILGDMNTVTAPGQSSDFAELAAALEDAIAGA
jgi:internalin A